ncbi:MAG: hypothetical protein AAB316_23055 [Bacteroidota bacterium]
MEKFLKEIFPPASDFHLSALSQELSQNKFPPRSFGLKISIIRLLLRRLKKGGFSPDAAGKTVDYQPFTDSPSTINHVQ